jgi:hypothetical protein
VARTSGSLKMSLSSLMKMTVSSAVVPTSNCTSRAEPSATASIGRDGRNGVSYVGWNGIAEEAASP